MNAHQIAQWITAHPLEALMALGVLLNLVNGLLPSRVRSGPVGRAVHVLLDRVSVLTRADAPGTLKWPLVVGSILRAGADAIDPPMLPGPDEEVCLVCSGNGVRSALSITSNPDGTRTEKGYLAHCTYCGGTGRKPKGSQEAPRAAERGSARPGAMLAVVVLALGAYLVVGCGPAREAVMRAAPGVPSPSGCTPGTQRCDGQLPEVCSSSGRWWPSLPVRPDGTQRECVSCVVEDGVAGCAR